MAADPPKLSAFDQQLHLPSPVGLSAPMWNPDLDTQPTTPYLGGDSLTPYPGQTLGFSSDREPYLPAPALPADSGFGDQGVGAVDVNMDGIDADTVALWLQAPSGFGWVAQGVPLCLLLTFACFSVNDWEAYLGSFAMDGSPNSP